MNEAIGTILLSPRRILTGDPAGQALENICIGRVCDGAICYVLSGSGQGVWQLEKGATDDPDGTHIIAPIGGVGRWFLKWAPGPSALTPTNDYADFNDLSGQTVPYKAGRTYYADNVLNTMTDIEGVTIQNGEEIQQPIVNKSGADRDNGDPVYVQGQLGQRLAVGYPDANDPATLILLGMLTHDVANNANGRATTYGLVHDVDTSAWNVKDILYVAQGGGLTTTRPTAAGTWVGVVGIVTAKHPTQGVIAVGVNVSPPIAGTKAQRPVAPRVGESWFDTSEGGGTGRPTWWNGTNWTLADGTVVA